MRSKIKIRGKIIVIMALFLAVIFSVLIARTINQNQALKNSKADTVSCSQPNAQFWTNCTDGSDTPGCGGLQGWIDGGQVTKTIASGTLQPPFTLDIGCFINNGDGWPNSRIEFYKDGTKIQDFATSTAIGIQITDLGSYSAKCIDQTATSCTNTDQFTVVKATPHPQPVGKQNACGQGCSGDDSVGLCKDGYTCRFIDGITCESNVDAKNPTKTFCVPINANLPTNWAATVCNGPQNNTDSFVTFNGNNPTTAQLQQLCAQVASSSSASSSSSSPPPGSIGCGIIQPEDNGTVGIKALDKFASIYGKSCSDSPLANAGQCGANDSNNDGKIDIVDFNSFAKKYGQGCAQAN